MTQLREPPLPAAARSRAQANRTRFASGPPARLLSPPFSTVATRIGPDPRIRPDGQVRLLHGYDMGMPPPPRPDGAVGSDVGRLDVRATTEFLIGRLEGLFGEPARLSWQVKALLRWLSRFDGDDWEERWLASGADLAPQSWRDAVYGPGRYRRNAVSLAMNALLVGRVLRPSYGWQLAYRLPKYFAGRMLVANDPGSLVRLRQLPAYRQALPRQQIDTEACLARVMVRTGRTLEQLTGEQLLYYADVVKTSGRHRREHLAWELLVALGPLRDEPPTLRAAWSAKGNSRQHSVATLVDCYGIPPSGARDLLVDYLGEVRVGMDYSSLEGLAYRLARLFWWEVLQINPGQATLHLDHATVTAWRERLALTTDGRPRREIHSTLFAVRALYRDLVGRVGRACPVPRRESRNASKMQRRQKSRMQARTRALAPLLPALVAEAAGRKDWSGRLLAAAEGTSDGGQFVVDGVTYRRLARPPVQRYQVQSHVWADVVDAEPDGPAIPREHGRVNVTRLESDGFWAWAIVETLRHTGIRIEELLELTQLSLRHYTSEKTGTLVPLLHIVPSKTDVERLIPMSPDLVTVLLAVQRRAKGGQAQIPLSVRYDPHEKVHGEPFPHLFSRHVGTRQEVLSLHYVRRVLNCLADTASLSDGGQPVTFTPHDFRRLFTTDMVNSGLPLHIAAALLGHLSLETTRGYTALFPEQVIAAHQAFIERRRRQRPEGEMRSATGEEWQEFEDHFLLRKVALGDCHRPYGTPCVHEHACARCRFLRVDPAQLPRIEEMTRNAEARLEEARDRAWLGEVVALEDSLKHLRQRNAEARTRSTGAAEDDLATLMRG